ncbi:MAG: hypothetical protein JSR59_12910 [Proteobacteria bacterium]|nr:hypothetical protein [Pseudomonadota bacterium]
MHPLAVPSTRWYRSLLALLLASLAVVAQAATSCDAMLRPAPDQVAADYAVARAYVALEAASEYERLTLLDARGRMADPIYRLYAVEFDGSRSAEEFRQRLRVRWRDEDYEAGVLELRGLARSHVSARQIADWSTCAAKSASGSLLLVAAEPNATSFRLEVAFVPPAGIEQSTIVLSLDGARVDGQHTVSDRYDGKLTRSYVVKPEPGSRRVIVNATIAGVSDALIVDVAPRPPLVSITACDELAGVRPRSDAEGAAGLVPLSADDRAKPWGIGCKATRRAVALQVAADAPADAAMTVSVCDGPAGMTYRRTAGQGFVLSPESRPGATVVQACRAIVERRVRKAAASCADPVPALVCGGTPRPLALAGDVVVPAAAKRGAESYALLCASAHTQPVCAAGE